MRDFNRRNRMGKIGPLADERLFGPGFTHKVKEHTAPLVWAELVGPQIAQATEVDKVSGGILFVSTKSAMWASELTFYKPDILKRLNEKIGARPGEPIITDLRFANKGLRKKKAGEQDVPPPLTPTREELEDVELSPRELATIEAGIAIVADEGLRTRLRRVRIADTKLRTWRLDNAWVPCPDCGDLTPPPFPVGSPLSCSRCRVQRHLGR